MIGDIMSNRENEEQAAERLFNGMQITNEDSGPLEKLIASAAPARFRMLDDSALVDFEQRSEADIWSSIVPITEPTEQEKDVIAAFAAALLGK